jgi:hypothetical protein
VPTAEIAVIAPFRAQVRLLRSAIQQSGLPNFEDLVVDTVERIQGQEREVVVVSLTAGDPFAARGARRVPPVDQPLERRAVARAHQGGAGGQRARVRGVAARSGRPAHGVALQGTARSAADGGSDRGCTWSDACPAACW